MSRNPHSELSKRERQIMDVLYRLGRATAAEVQAELPGKPNYSTVRAQLRVLEEKGHIRHQEEGLRYVYLPVVSRTAARTAALRHLIETFFQGSTENVVASLLGGGRVTPDELDRIAAMIERAKEEGRNG